MMVGRLLSFPVKLHSSGLTLAYLSLVPAHSTVLHHCLYCPSDRCTLNSKPQNRMHQTTSKVWVSSSESDPIVNVKQIAQPPLRPKLCTALASETHY